MIRLATAGDAAAIAGIYAPYVRETPITFETEVPSVAEIGGRIERTIAGHPWLVCERDGAIIGYAYGGAYRTRAAYQWSVEVTVYVHRNHHRRGVGRALYTSLLELLRLQGFFNAYAVITVPNAGSVGLHEDLGFTSAGITRRVGFKLGRWHDVGTWELPLRAPSIPSGPPLSLDAIRENSEWRRALENDDEHERRSAEHAHDRSGGPFTGEK
jgi:L-amino acid N-acyltransferase YncA